MHNYIKYSRGYKDETMVKQERWPLIKYFSLFFALIFILGAWLFLDYKLLVGEEWISQTYDNNEWRTNEGNLHTFGAWDLETHIWKTEFILKYFPHFNWNPSWYLGMPLFEYYPLGFYVLHGSLILLTNLSASKAATYLIIFSHLLAVLLTFLVCYKVSRKIWPAALSSIFLLSSSFTTLRSYGWEPISVIFMFFYPLALLLFLRKPLQPFRFSMVIILTLAYLCHPLIFFSLAMTMGVYLFSIEISSSKLGPSLKHKHEIMSYFKLIFASILLGAIQFIPEIRYNQVTSGAHMGVKYLPFYHIEYNIINFFDFLFDAGNLKGPGLSIMVAMALFLLFLIFDLKSNTRTIFKNQMVNGFMLVLVTMVAFYYMEQYNIFPMNLLRSIQYHRIIPEFIILASIFTSSLYNLANTSLKKIVYYSILVSFVISSLVVIYNIQEKWQTTDNITDRPEFINHNFTGRISFPYTDQSLAVRSSFNEIPQTYGYFEQGITNSYVDEIFSVSSGYHPYNVSLLYLKAANVERLYINEDEGARDQIVAELFKNELVYKKENERYSYFEIPIVNSEFSQTVSLAQAEQVQSLAPSCRTLFKVEYCGSEKEEFVKEDIKEIDYLSAYVSLVEEASKSRVTTKMINPERYLITVSNANEDTAIVVKMTYNHNFQAWINDQEIEIEKIGPDFMILKPKRAGNYEIFLTYNLDKSLIVGAVISLLTLIFLLFHFALFAKPTDKRLFKKGDM